MAEEVDVVVARADLSVIELVDNDVGVGQENHEFCFN